MEHETISEFTLRVEVSGNTMFVVVHRLAELGIAMEEGHTLLLRFRVREREGGDYEHQVFAAAEGVMAYLSVYASTSTVKIYHGNECLLSRKGEDDALGNLSVPN